MDGRGDGAASVQLYVEAVEWRQLYVEALYFDVDE